MRYLLESWRTVCERLRSANAIALFLDFDGTLAALQSRPELVQLPPATRRVLRRLSLRRRVRVWVISGRRQADVSMRVALPAVRCLGLYGWENGNPPPLDTSTLRIMAQAGGELAETLDHSGGLWIENKGPAFALHYRGATPAGVHRARIALQELQTRFGQWLSVTEGNHIWEVMPRQLSGKGDAVRRQLREFKYPALPIYIGDDAGDESAFAALAGGITACVGPVRQTRANFRLRDPGEVRRFLEKLDREAPILTGTPSRKAP